MTRAVGRVGREVRAVGTRAQSVGLVSAVRAHRYWDEMGFPRGAPPPSEASAEAYVADAMGDGEAATGVWEAAGEASKAGVSVWVRRVPGARSSRCAAVLSSTRRPVVLDLLTTGDEDTIRTSTRTMNRGGTSPAAAASRRCRPGAADGAVRVSYARVRAAALVQTARHGDPRRQARPRRQSRRAAPLGRGAPRRAAARPVRARVARGMHLLEPTEGGSTYTFTQQIDWAARALACTSAALVEPSSSASRAPPSASSDAAALLPVLVMTDGRQ